MENNAYLKMGIKHASLKAEGKWNWKTYYFSALKLRHLMRHIATTPTDKLVNVLIRDRIAKLTELCCYGALN